MKRKWMTVCLLAAACGPRGDDAALGGEVPPPAAALAQITSTTPLDDGLAMLQDELAPVLRGEVDDDDANLRLMRAEALTDRLLETRVPFEWLTSENYGLDARLRQIQSRADRIVAEIRSSAPTDSIIADVRALHRDATELREAIAQGGTRAPASFEELRADWEAGRRATPPPRPPAPAATTPPDTTG